jgi:hypothetical protein
MREFHAFAVYWLEVHQHLRALDRWLRRGLKLGSKPAELVADELMKSCTCQAVENPAPILFCAALLQVAGCKSIGPETLLRDIQDAGTFGMRMEEATNGQSAAVFFFRAERIEPEIEAQITEARRLLGVAKGTSGFRLVQSPLRGGPGELGIATRSLIQIMAALARGVEVPPQHLQRKLTPPIPESVAPNLTLLCVHSGSAKPADSFVAVPYQGEWFWVANDDWKSKRTFSSLLFLFTLAEAGGPQQLPTITIPAQ